MSTDDDLKAFAERIGDRMTDGIPNAMASLRRQTRELALCGGLKVLTDDDWVVIRRQVEQQHPEYQALSTEEWAMLRHAIEKSLYGRS